MPTWPGDYIRFVRTPTLLVAFAFVVACGGGTEATREPRTGEPDETNEERAQHDHEPFEFEAIVAQIDDIETPLLPQWESEVHDVLVGMYDADESGQVDTDDEVDHVPCEVWRAIDDGFRQRAVDDESIRDAYGFAPDTLYIDALGVGRSQRERLRVKLVDCGVR